MRIYSSQSVFDAALDRIRWCFAEFPVVIVNMSGGKDSTVVFQLAVRVAAEMQRLPLPLLFIDQEAEWQTVITYIRHCMADPRVHPYWLQCPLKISNATSTREPWLYCWQPGKAWIRAKEPTSLHENVYGTDVFAKLFAAFSQTTFPDTPLCHLAGVRCEESPGRLYGLTAHETYKGVTWGRNERPGQHTNFVFYPLYDWSYTDVWKAIHDEGWPYCPLYDLMYQYGIPVRNMRVSNVHHQTAIKSLYFMQELDPVTWNAVTARLAGINSAGRLQADWEYLPTELPPMFANWYEYRDYLLQHLVTDPAIQATLREQFASYEGRYRPEAQADLLAMQFKIILSQDSFRTKLDNFRPAHRAQLIRKRPLAGDAAVVPPAGAVIVRGPAG